MAANLTVLKERLTRERGQLVEELSGYSLEAQQNPGYGNHMADDATEVFEQAKSLALRQRLERSLDQIDNALKKFDGGAYGTCEACGHPIDPARLKAKPAAQLCMSCRQRAEQSWGM